MSNIISRYEELPVDVKRDIKTDLLVVLNRVMEYGSQTIPPDLKEKLKALVNRVNSGA